MKWYIVSVLPKANKVLGNRPYMTLGSCVYDFEHVPYLRGSTAAWSMQI